MAMGAGSGGSPRPASARQPTISSRAAGLLNMNVIRPSTPIRSSWTYGELHFAQRA